MAFSSKRLLRLLIESVSGASESYDEKADLDGYFQFRRVLYEDPARFLDMLSKPSTIDANGLLTTVMEIVQQFTQLVENNNMWELLWHGDAPRHERASQLLFFAVATVMCAVNNVDISPETNWSTARVGFRRYVYIVHCAHYRRNCKK